MKGGGAMVYALAVFIHSVFVIHKLTTASEHKTVR